MVTMTEGPTGPTLGAPELLMTSAVSLLQDQPVASLPWVLATGSRDSGLSPEVRGSIQRSCGSPGGFPTSGRKGRKKSLVAQVRRTARACLCPVPTCLQQGCQGQNALARSPSGLFPLLHPWPVSSLWVPAQLWPPRALCCTYSRLVFIPCEDDILFLLSVSVFMCEELLACCARARGELVPRD